MNLKDSSATLLVVLGIGAGLLPWLLPTPSRRTRVIGGSACLVLLLLALVLSSWEPKGPGPPRLKTIAEAGHNWPVLPTAWSASPVDTIVDGPFAASNHVVLRTAHRRIQVVKATNGTSAWPPYVTKQEAGSLSVVGNRIVFMNGKEITALEVASGKRKLNSNVGDLAGGSFVLAKDSFVVADGYRVGAFSSSTGKMRWQSKPEEVAPEKVLVAGATVFAADGTGRIYAIDLRSGKRKWTYMIPHGDPVEDDYIAGGGATESMAAVGNVLLFRAGPAGNVYAINATTSQALWGRSLGKRVRAIKAGNGQALVVVEDEDTEKVVAVDASSGAELWSHRMARATVTAKRLYGVVDDTEENEKYHLVAIDLDSGKEVWRTSLEDQSYLLNDSRISVGELLYFNTEETLYMLDPSTGKPRGIYKATDLGSDDSATISVEIDKLTVVNAGDRLVALRRG